MEKDQSKKQEGDNNKEKIKQLQISENGNEQQQDSHEEDEEDDEEFVDPNKLEDIGEEVKFEDDKAPTDEQGGNGGEGDEDPDLDYSERDYLHHTEPVYCLSFNKSKKGIFASGGGDDIAYIWNIDSEDPIHTLKGHTDSIVSISFSHDGKYLATAALDATLKIWDSNTAKLLNTFDGPSESIECIVWHDKGPVIFAGGGDGVGWLWNASNKQTLNVFSGHSASIRDASFTSDGKKIITVSDDKTLRIWDPKTAKSLNVVSGYNFHTEAINTLSVHSEGVVAITGGQDALAHIVNLTTAKSIGQLKSHEDSVEDTAFVAGFPWAVTGSLDGNIIVWDFNTSQPRQVIKNGEGEGITRIMSVDQVIWSSDITGVVRKWDAKTGKKIEEWKAHTDAILDFDISTDKENLITAGEDTAIRLFLVNQPKQPKEKLGGNTMDLLNALNTNAEGSNNNAQEEKK